MSLLGRRIMSGGAPGTPGTGNGGGSFDPWSASYPTPLDAVWAGDPDWTDPGDGNAVSSWRNEGDRAGSDALTQATGSKQPIYRASTAAFNNRPTVEFDGTDDELFDDVSDHSAAWILVVVGSTGGANSNSERLVSHRRGRSGAGVGKTSGDAWTYDMNADPAPTGGTADADPHVFVLRQDAGNDELYIDGVQVIDAGGGSENFSQFTVGSSGSGDYLAGHIAYAAFYNKSSRDADIQAIESALGDHYGITIS